MKRIVIDTNAYIKLLAGTTEVLDAITIAEVVYMTIFVLGELYAGFKGGSKEHPNRKILNRFLNRSTVKILNATSETAEVFAEVKNKLKKTGRPIPINDVWIAAHALETGSVLVTYDKHFKFIDGLRVWDGG
jgi:tRNA(fMet)-specific endonuclease VapC